jgi:hypothetical protein
MGLEGTTGGIDVKEEKTRVQKLVDLIMQEYTFVTTTDIGQLYHFNGKIYVPDQEWIIKKKCRLALPKVTSHDIQEVINYIKDLTQVLYMKSVK